MWDIFMFYIKDHPEYEDAKQEAEMLYIEKGMNLEVEDKLKWINRTVYLLIRNYIRKNSHCVSLSSLSEDYEVSYIDFDSYYFLVEYPDFEEDMTMNSLLDELPQLENEIFKLHLDGYSNTEISEKFSITNNNIRQKIYKIKHKLIEYYDYRKIVN